MKKYIINIVSSRFKNDPIGGGASSKAPADILTLAKENGYEEIDIYDYQSYGKLRKTLNLFIQLIRVKHSLEEKTVVCFQYPHISPCLIPLFKFIFRRQKRIAVIHDINSVRTHGALSAVEIKALNCFDVLYVHTKNMKNYLSKYLKNGIEYHILECFPYFVPVNSEQRIYSNRIVFAGNLDKSKFLSKFLNVNKSLDILLYGQTTDFEKFEGKATYMGKFMPNETQNIKGSWGLVWDGDSIDTCSGYYGDYLKIIAPHKFSMYLVAELPVIVWKHSAMADLVDKYGLGITIEKLTDINQILVKDCCGDIYNKYIGNIKSFVQNNLNQIDF